MKFLFKKKEAPKGDYISEDLRNACRLANAEERAVMANSKVKAKSVNGIHLYEWSFGAKKVTFNGSKNCWVREKAKA